MELTIKDIIQRLSETPPQQPAIHFFDLPTRGDQGLTQNFISYGDLLQRCHQINSLLLNRPHPLKPFLITSAKSLETYSAVISGLLLGIPFLPVSPLWTSDKVRALALTIDASLWIGAEKHSHHQSLVNELGLQTIEMNGLNHLPLSPWRIPLSESAYYISTSGSTGDSKLVLIKQNQFLPLLSSLVDLYPLTQSDRWSNAFDLCFDPSLVDIFLPLIQGASLVPLKDEFKFDIFNFIHRTQLTHWASTPSLVELNFRRHSKAPPSPTNHLKQTLFTGESLSPLLVQNWGATFPSSAIDNLYGPVEATIWACRAQVDPQSMSIPIGRCLPRFQYAIVNENNEPVSEDEEGELLLSGPQVFEGYVSGSEEFNSPLIAFPENSKDRNWLATGDLVKEKNGNLFFRGRKDFQFKIAGQRISPEDLENQIARNLGVTVILIPYLISQQSSLETLPQGTELILIHSLSKDTSATFNQDLSLIFKSLQSWFSKELPPLFYPKRWWVCDQPPLNTSDKIIRALLIQQARRGELFQQEFNHGQ